MTVNQRVTGSSPVSGALKIKGLQNCNPFFISLLRHNYVTKSFLKPIFVLFYHVANST